MKYRKADTRVAANAVARFVLTEMVRLSRRWRATAGHLLWHHNFPHRPRTCISPRLVPGCAGAGASSSSRLFLASRTWPLSEDACHAHLHLRRSCDDWSIAGFSLPVNPCTLRRSHDLYLPVLLNTDHNTGNALPKHIPTAKSCSSAYHSSTASMYTIYTHCS